MNARIFERTWVQGEIYQKPDNLYNYAFQGEAAADTFIIDGKTKVGESVEITGEITGIYLGENRVSVPLAGTVTNGKAVITLDAACYLLPGKFTVSIYAKNNDERICLYCCVGYMLRTQSDVIINPTDAIPAVQDLVEEVQAVIDSIPEDYSTLAAHFPETGKFVVGSGSATANYAVAEGSGTYATGFSSHAEGAGSLSSGAYSHAEGNYTSASGPCSHSEGASTTASGAYSHASGYGTSANHKSQLVFGEYNVNDSSASPDYNRGNYVEIVGNGTSSMRSNARTLDWAGNEVLAGDITINKGSANEMTIGDAIQALRQAIIALGGNL